MHWTEWILAYGPNTRLLARLSWDIIREHSTLGEHKGFIKDIQVSLDLLLVAKTSNAVLLFQSTYSYTKLQWWDLLCHVFFMFSPKSFYIKTCLLDESWPVCIPTALSSLTIKSALIWALAPVSGCPATNTFDGQSWKLSPALALALLPALWGVEWNLAGGTRPWYAGR